MVGVEDVGHQRHRTTEDRRSLFEQCAGGRVTATGERMDALDVDNVESECERGLDNAGVTRGRFEATRVLRVEQGGRPGREVSDHRRARGRCVHCAVDAERDADHLTCVEVEEARALVAGVHHELGSGHRFDVRRHRYGQPDGFGDDAAHRCIRPAETRVIDEATFGHTATDRDTGPEDSTVRPASDESTCAVADGGQRLLRGLGDRSRDLDGTDDAMQQVVGGDRGDLVSDVDTEGQEVGHVDFERQARTSDGAGGREVSAFTQETRLQQRADLTVHCRDGQSGCLRGVVAEDRAGESSGAQHERCGFVGELEARSGDLNRPPPSPGTTWFDPGNRRRSRRRPAWDRTCGRPSDR